MIVHATALIADDEPLLRDALRRQLANVWPELEIVAEARNGREAVRLFDQRQPDICFLDVHMPGLSGVDAANHIRRRAHLVFVTAYDHYAVQAFAQGVLDYLLRPVEQARLAETVSRLKERLHRDQRSTRRSYCSSSARSSRSSSAAGSATRCAGFGPKRARPCASSRLTTSITFGRTRSTRSSPGTTEGNPPRRVNLRAIGHVKRHDNETAAIHLKGRNDLLPVSRNYMHLFRQM